MTAFEKIFDLSKDIVDGLHILGKQESETDLKLLNLLRKSAIELHEILCESKKRLDNANAEIKGEHNEF